MEGVSSPRDPPPPPPPTERTVRHSVSWQVDVLIVVKRTVCSIMVLCHACFLEVFSFERFCTLRGMKHIALGCSPASSVRQSVWRQRSPPRASFFFLFAHAAATATASLSADVGRARYWRNANSLRKFPYDGVHFRKGKLSLH